MEEQSYKEILKNKDVELKDIVLRKGTFEREDGTKIDWKSYNLKVKIEGIVMNFKLDKTFNDTLEEIVTGE